MASHHRHKKQDLLYAKQTLARLVTADRKKRHDRVIKHKTNLRKSLEWDVQKIRQVLHDKIMSRVRRPQDTMRVAYRIFGAPKNGINREAFKKSMRRLDLHLSEEEFEKMFCWFDADASGIVSFNEFIKLLIPQAYTRKQWVEKRSEQMHSHSKDYTKPDAPNFPKSMKKFRWNLEDIQNMIRDKMVAHCKRPEDQYRTGFQIFGRPKHGVSVSVLKKTLNKLGISITQDEALQLMAKFDIDGSGKLDFDEFSKAVMPSDYTSEQWSSTRSKRMQRELKAKQLRVSVGVIEEHDRLVKNRAKMRESQRRKVIEDRTVKFQKAQQRLIAKSQDRKRQLQRNNCINKLKKTQRGENRPRSVRSRLYAQSIYKQYNNSRGNTFNGSIGLDDTSPIKSLRFGTRAQSAGYSRSSSNNKLHDSIPMATFKPTDNVKINDNSSKGILKTTSSPYHKRAQSALPRKRGDVPNANNLTKFKMENNNVDPSSSSTSNFLTATNGKRNFIKRSVSSSNISRPYSAMPISQRNLKEALEFAGSPQQLQGAAMSLTRKLKSRGRPKTAMMLSGLSLRTKHRDVRERAKINHGSGWR
eukprot:g3887.t1